MTDEITVVAHLSDDTTVTQRVAVPSDSSGRLSVTPMSPGDRGLSIQPSARGNGVVAVKCDPGLAVERLSVVCSTRLENFDRVIMPDTGRWFMNNSHPISAWRFSGKMQVRTNSLRTPLFVFEGLGGNVSKSIGLIAEPHEMDIVIHEPASNRALNVHYRRLTIEFAIGVDGARLRSENDSSQAFEVYILLREPSVPMHWTRAMREFSNLEQEILGIEYSLTEEAIEPYWCTWVDWSSDQVDQELVRQNIQRAAELGIKNVIVDDGWFGPGLDSPYEVPLNIGDWTPDKSRHPDFGKLISYAHELGTRLILWCAPHAVGPASKVFDRLSRYLIADSTGAPIINPTQFYSLCFRNALAREEMVRVVECLCSEYEIDGLKYDLFNWIPSDRCSSPLHTHDIESDIQGLREVLSRSKEVTANVGRPMIIELKQDYGSPRLAELGSVMRAGDAPYASATNLERTSYIQARGMPALNDYQTFSRETSPSGVALIGLRMVAAGVPAWGCDLTRLDARQAQAISELHRWYWELVCSGATWRRSHDDSGNLIIPLAKGNVVVLTTGDRPVIDVRADTLQIANGTGSDRVVLRSSTRRAINRVASLATPSEHRDLTTIEAGLTEVPLSTGEILYLD